MITEKLQIIHLKGGAEVLVDWKTQGDCKSCGVKIWWVKTKSGKMMPINLCGIASWESHFASCPDAKKFRKPK